MLFSFAAVMLVLDTALNASSVCGIVVLWLFFKMDDILWMAKNFGGQNIREKYGIVTCLSNYEAITIFVTIILLKVG